MSKYFSRIMEEQEKLRLEIQLLQGRLQGLECALQLIGDESVSDVHSKGGKARAASLTTERRAEIAALAAKARWNGDGK